MTLVELLLAITLFSSIMAAVGGLLHSSLRAQARWGETVEPYQRLERALNHLEQDVASMQPLFGVPVDGVEAQLEFARVDARSIDGAAASPEWLRVRYQVAVEAGGAALIREEFLWRQGGSSDEPLRRDTVLQLSDAVFAFGRLDEQGQLAWAGEWDGEKDGLPRLVRLTCALPAVGGQPPLQLARVFRNPSGALPPPEETP